MSLLLYRQSARKFGQNHRLRMQKVYFRSTCVAQKRLCLSSLLSNLFRTLSTPAITGNVVLSHANSDWYSISRWWATFLLGMIYSGVVQLLFLINLTHSYFQPIKLQKFSESNANWRLVNLLWMRKNSQHCHSKKKKFPLAPSSLLWLDTRVRNAMKRLRCRFINAWFPATRVSEKKTRVIKVSLS